MMLRLKLLTHIAVSSEAQDIREELSAIRRDIELALREKIMSAVASGELPAGTDAVALAAYVMTVIQGLSTMARDGSSRHKLSRVAQLSLTVWPSKKSQRLHG